MHVYVYIQVTIIHRNIGLAPGDLEVVLDQHPAVNNVMVSKFLMSSLKILFYISNDINCVFMCMFVYLTVVGLYMHTLGGLES